MTTVRDCDYPWSGFMIWASGAACCCCYGSMPVGDVTKASPESVWNNATMQSLRASLAAGVLHTVCQSGTCKYVVGSRAAEAASTASAVAIEDFDDAWYVSHYFDVLDGLGRGLWTSGLEHYRRFGHQEFRCRNAGEWKRWEKQQTQAGSNGPVYSATLSWLRPPSVHERAIVLNFSAINSGSIPWRPKGQGATPIQTAAESYRRLEDVHRVMPMYEYRGDLPASVAPGQAIALEMRVPLDDLPLGESFVVLELVCDRKSVRLAGATAKPLVLGVHRDEMTARVEFVTS
jgi:hypothetical protein